MEHIGEIVMETNMRWGGGGGGGGVNVMLLRSPETVHLQR